MAKLGMEHKLYYNTGTYASPTWVEITYARDVNLNWEFGEGNISSRASAHFKSKAALIRTTIEGDLLYQPGTAWTALIAIILARTATEFACYDGAIATSGSQGLRATMQFFGAGLNQPLEDGSTNPFTLKVTDATNDPAWGVTV